MEDKGKGFSLRQKKSRQVVPKQISGPIQTIPKGPARPNVNGKVETSAANTSDLVKRRYSTRFTNLPDFNNADVPPVPSVPSVPTIPAQFAQSDSRPSTARQNQLLQPDANALKDPNLQIEDYSRGLLSDASDQELRNYQASLRKLQNRTSTDLQQNVYQNRTQFIKISKEAEKLRGEMRTLRGLMSELTTSLNQASVNSGVPEPRTTLEDGARSKARKQANRSSVANLEAMWNTQLHTLWKNVEGSQKFLPAIPGRHVVLEQSTWLELDAATWKAKRYAHIFLLNDHLMVATKRKRRIDPNAITNGDAGQNSSSRTVADKCWPLQDIDIVDLASAGSSGVSDRSGMSNAVSIRHGHESFTYRSDKSSTTEKTDLLQAFRRTADELRKALQADMEEKVNKSKETMNYLTAKEPTSNKTDLLRSLSGAKDRPEILIDVDGKHQNLRWVDGQIDELDSEVALQKFEDAVRHVEKLRRLAKGLKGNMLAQDLISNKVDERARMLADILALRLTATHAQLTATQANIAYLVRLNLTPLARTTYLAARTDLIHTRARSIMFEGDLPQHINQLSYVYFILIRNTVKTFQQCFPPVMMSSCVQWAKERLDDFNALLGRQLGSVRVGSADWNDCLAKAVGNAVMVSEVGLDFANLATRRSKRTPKSLPIFDHEQILVMVRVKHRYLLVHILYPDPADSKVTHPAKPPEKAIPDLVQFHRPSPDDLTPQLLARTIRNQVLLLYGDYGLGLVSSSLNVKYLSPATSTAIVRCSRAHYRLVWAALSFTTQLPKTSKQAQPAACAIQVVRVSGTIKKAEEEAIRRARAAILRARRESGEGSADDLLGILGKDEEEALQGGGNMTAGSDGSDEDDETDDVRLDSDEDG